MGLWRFFWVCAFGAGLGQLVTLLALRWGMQPFAANVACMPLCFWAGLRLRRWYDGRGRGPGVRHG